MIRVECHTCQKATEEPDIGPGRVRIAEWLTNHQDHRIERTHL